MTTVFLAFLLSLPVSGEAGNEPLPQERERLQPGDHIWVGYGMAKGYHLPFRKKLTVKKARYLFMKEIRVVFVEYPQRFYLRSDFGPSYAFWSDPAENYSFSPEQWETIRRGSITVGMHKNLFLMVMPKSEEIHSQPGSGDPVEQWIYREHPKELYGSFQENPPTHIYYFQNDILISIL